MSEAVQVDVLWSGLRNNSGQPLAEGKVYTYSAGTTSNKAVYTDQAATTPAANPLILDANGRAQVYANGEYKFRIDDSDDNTIQTLDNLVYQSPAIAAPTDWTPTVGAGVAMTVSSVTINEAKYAMISDELVFVSVYITFTVGGTLAAGDYVSISLPEASTALTDGQGFGAMVNPGVGGGPYAGFGYVNSTSDVFYIFNNDSGAWVSGTGRTIRFATVYRT